MNDAPSVGGRRLVRRVIAVMIIFSLGSVILSNLQDRSGATQDLVRFGFTVALCFFLSRGRVWARWTTAVLFFAGTVVAGTAVASAPHLVPGIFFTAMGFAYLWCGALLVFSKQVSAFFTSSPSTVSLPEIRGSSEMGLGRSVAGPPIPAGIKVVLIALLAAMGFLTAMQIIGLLMWVGLILSL